MPLTPADVHNVAFSKPPIGKRGYNEDEVDQFLDLVEDTLAQLQDENDDLRARVDEVAAGGGAAAASASQSSAVDEAAVRKQVEQELRAEYEKKLRDAKTATDKAEAEARTAKSEAENARKQAEAAKQDADKRVAEAKRSAESAAKSTTQGSSIAAPAAAAAAGASAEAASADTHVQAAKVLGLAQEMADRLTSDAQAEARSMLDEACLLYTSPSPRDS